MKTALITGATSGIGKATASLFAQKGFNLILTGRRWDKLMHLSDSLKSQFGIEVLPLVFDVRHPKEVENVLGSLQTPWNEIDVLVNNAGLALGASTLDQGSLDDWDTMIDTNVKGLLYVTKIIAPLLIERKKGHIINISSIAGKEVYLNGNVYCASKHAVDALSKAMRIDFLPHGIKVTNIAPGMVDTEFSLVRYHGDKEKADAVYKDLEPLHAIDIAEVIWFVVNRPANVNINDLVIMPTVQASTSHLLRNPKRL
jgi:NADP-dependent 3-hydroxy acid dehydrogenase YdfG